MLFSKYIEHKVTWVLLHKISVSIECYIFPTSWQCKSGAQTPILLFQILTSLQSGGNFKDVQCKKSDQDNEEDGSHSSKIEQRVIQRDCSPKSGKYLKKKKTRKRRHTSSSSQSRSPPRRRKKRSKKPSKKKRSRRSASSSSSSSSPHSSSSKSKEEDQEAKRFHTVSNENQFKWDVPSELASYANRQFEKYTSLEKSIHGAICAVHPLPKNLNQVKKMDKFLRDLLKEKNKNNSLAINEILGKIQKRTLSVMGPLSKLWLKLENAKKSDAPPLSLENRPFVYLVKQVI